MFFLYSSIWLNFDTLPKELSIISRFTAYFRLTMPKTVITQVERDFV